MLAKELTPLLQTKIHPPRVAHGPIVRPQLFDLLDQGRDHILTLVAAPPGYGKSVLLTTWLADRNLSFGWVSLDANDNNEETFLIYLLAAIQHQYPGACHKTVNLLSNPQPLNLPALAVSLIEDLMSFDKPVLLVLDDYHYIRNKEIHDFLSELINKPPPQLRLIILTRRDPPLLLNTLRSQGGLTELRMQDLKFTPEEAATFLLPASKDTLSEQTIQNLDAQLEGWPAGLRLVSLNLRYCKDANQFLGDLKGSPQVVREYLMNEVLAQQPDLFRQCLLRVSVLDRFCAPLCKSLCLSADPDLENKCRAMHGDDEFPLMANLLESNLFMIALDDEGTWYRFHHLFQDFLKDRLKADSGEKTIAALYGHAADWFASQDLLEEAVNYLLKGPEPGKATQLVIQHRERLMQIEQDARLSHLINMLPAEQVAVEPVLLLQQAWFLLELLELEGDNVLNRAESLISKMSPDDPATKRLMGEVHAIRSLQYCELMDSSETRRQAEQALNLLEDDQLVARGIARVIHIYSLQMDGHMNEAKAQVFEAFKDPHIQNTAFHTRLLSVLCFMYWSEADLDGMGPAVAELGQLGRKLGFPHAIAHSLYLEGILHYERNEIDEAEGPLTEVLEKYPEANLKNTVQSSFALALTYEAQRRHREARELAEQVIQQALEFQNAPLLQSAEAFMADINLRQGKLSDAVLWAENFDLDPRHSSARFFVPHLTLAKVLLADDRPESLERAGQLINQLEEIHTSSHNKRVLIHVLILKAHFQEKTGPEEDALKSLGEALQLAQPGGIIRPFVGLSPKLIPLLNRLNLDAEGIEYVGRILSGFSNGKDRSLPPSAEERENTSHTRYPIPVLDDPMVDHLTDRELDVLQLLSHRLSNREIAERLFIAPGTVKRHTNTIYSKLNVHSRRDAVAKASGLGLLD